MATWQPASRPSCSAGWVTWPLTSAHAAPPAIPRALLAHPGAAHLAPRAPALGPGAAFGPPPPRPPRTPASSTPLRGCDLPLAALFSVCSAPRPQIFISCLTPCSIPPSQVRRELGRWGRQGRRLRGSAPQAPLAPPGCVGRPGPLRLWCEAFWREGGRSAWTGKGQVGGQARGWGRSAAATALPGPPPCGDDGGPFLQFCVVERADPEKCHLWAGRRSSCLPRTQGGAPRPFRPQRPGPAPTPPPVSLPTPGEAVKAAEPTGVTSLSTAHDGAPEEHYDQVTLLSLSWGY